MRQFILYLLLILLAHSQSSNTNTIFQFLNHHYGARSTALSGANSATDNSIADFLQNPASINTNEQNLSISYNDYLIDTKYGQIAYNYPITKGQSISFAVIALMSNNFEHRLEDGALIGNYSATDFGLIISLVDKNLFDDFSLALTGNLVQSSIQDFQSSAILASISTLYSPSTIKNHQFGLIFDNLGFQLSNYLNQSESLPFAIRLGYSYQLEKAPIQLMFHFKQLENQNPLKSVSIATEVTIKQTAAIRISYDSAVHNSFQLRNERNLFSGFSFGTGISKDSHQVDISYSIYGFLGNRISFTYQKTFN